MGYRRCSTSECKTLYKSYIRWGSLLRRERPQPYIDLTESILCSILHRS